MTRYQYAGVDPGGRAVAGTVTADSPRAGRGRLRAQGVAVTAMTQVAAGGSWFQTLRRRHAAGQWAGAAHELAMLLRSGTPLDDSLQTLQSQYRGPFGQTLGSLRESVTAGRSLAESMGEHPDIFDAASIRLVEVGENTGTLETIFDELADYLKRTGQFSDRLVNALLYPAFVMVFGAAAMIFLMTWVLPPLLDSLRETLPTIPLPTRIAKSISDALVHHGGKLLLAVAITGVAVWSAMKRPGVRRRRDRWLLRLPVVGTILVKQIIARVALIIGLLLRSGIPLPQALALAARSVRHDTVAATLRRAEEDLAAGRDLATSLTRSGLFPPLALRIFTVGQDSGRLDEMLIQLGEDYNDQVQSSCTRLAAVLEPVMILVVAVLVGFLLLATILPILQAGQAIG